jgi:hypothetical protein
LVGELTENTAWSPGASTVSAAVRVVPLYVALIVDEELLATVDVLIVNAALDWPPTTITVDGTCATLGLLLVRFTMTPLDGAELFSVSTPVGCCCPWTDDWVSVSEESERPDGAGVGGLPGDGLEPPDGSGELGVPLPQPVTTVPVIRITKIAAIRNAQPRREGRRISPRTGDTPS